MGRTKRTTVVAVMALMAVVGAATPAWAPQPAKPEKLTIDSVQWNSIAQAFEVGMSASYGTATSGEQADFNTVTTIEVVGHARLGPVESAIVPQRQPSPGERVPLVPVRVGWDRNSGTVTGPVRAVITVELRNAPGETRGDQVMATVDVDVAPDTSTSG